MLTFSYFILGIFLAELERVGNFKNGKNLFSKLCNINKVKK